MASKFGFDDAESRIRRREDGLAFARQIDSTISEIVVDLAQAQGGEPRLVTRFYENREMDVDGSPTEQAEWTVYNGGSVNYVLSLCLQNSIRGMSFRTYAAKTISGRDLDVLVQVIGAATSLPVEVIGRHRRR